MKKVVWYCDHCGKQFDSRTGYPELDVGVEAQICTDLCCECVEKLDEQIGAFCSCGKQKDGADNER